MALKSGDIKPTCVEPNLEPLHLISYHPLTISFSSIYLNASHGTRIPPASTP